MLLKPPSLTGRRLHYFSLLEIYLFCCNRTSLFVPWMDCRSSSISDVEVLYLHSEVFRPRHLRFFDVCTVFMIAGFRFCYIWRGINVPRRNISVNLYCMYFETWALSPRACRRIRSISPLSLLYCSTTSPPH